MPFAPGENVGPYRILEQLGQGGMATVYKAYHAALDRYVAIKVLHPAFTQDPNFLSRFQREARVVAKLEHPNIVPVYDFSEHEGQPYLVMKFIQGETLKARLARGPISQEEVLRVVEAIGAALSYAHEKGILHRDIKPSNVILADDGRIYLADFGLARIAQAGESTLSSDMLLGTPQYISPEQALGKPDLDEGTDIYSFGVVLYELVVGKVPYSADTPYSIIHDHIYTPLPLPRRINPEVPEAVERVLLKALAKDRADRYPDVNNLVKAFREAYSAQLIQPPVTVTQPTGTVAAEREPDEAPTQFQTPGETQKAEVPSTEAAATSEPEKKLRWRWWYLLPLGLACLCGLIVLGSASQQDRGHPAAAPPPMVTESGPPTQAVRPTAKDDTQAPPPSLDLSEAMRNLDANPDDPYAYLKVADAYIYQGNLQEAAWYLEKGSEKSHGDPFYYVAAGDIFMKYHRPVQAAQAYLTAIQFLGDTAPDEVVDHFHQSVYQAAALPNYPREVSFDTLAETDLTLAGIAKARHLLYAGDITGAQELLASVQRRKPDMPEVLLLTAEIQIEKGATEEARTQLYNLISSPKPPTWIKVEARRLLQKIQP